ncbi:hypothetical protein MmarC5_1482 [Methanococcus maripaludis C5]|uniref:Uncharacterized protein n=1 Tax=Methanococcus maripaludis (strain C5 / ATCC BAA-1333) TaxID=402880 RepID=A4FZZ5_METM5|nr:hypothetical protein [Methanococcus maripaludis]ABO35779.1 hypothetical protein MmarC5_1482 [Methanococcus maripaludis C5]
MFKTVQKIRIPRNHRVTIEIPEFLKENEEIEIVITANPSELTLSQKLELMKMAAKDKMYLNDISEINEEYKYVDSTGW